MKKTIVILITFMSVYLNAQTKTLYSDDKGVIVICKVQQTKQTTSCQGNTNSTKKINIWKVTLSIENGHSESIVPRGVGIADISIYPNPIKPYSHEYCKYTYVKNFEPNSVQRHLDQSLYVWPILDFRIEEIKPGQSITNTTYLYLYNEQQPKLTNWEFLGYRLKNDFVANDDINIKTSSSLPNNNVSESQLLIANTEKMITKNLDSISKPSLSGNVTLLNEDFIVAASVSSSANNLVNNEVIIKEKVIEISKDSITDEEIMPKIEAKNKIIKTADCPGEKSLEYKDKSNTSPNIKEQKAYSWLALYYSYLCKCESGMPDSDQLVAVINNVVDSYMFNTNGKYGKISKVTKCKSPVEN